MFRQSLKKKQSLAELTLLRSKIKQGRTCSTYKNIWQETIGIYFGHKLLILIQFPKNVFRGVPRD